MAAANGMRTGVLAERMHNLHRFRDVSKAIQRRLVRYLSCLFAMIWLQPAGLMSKSPAPSGKIHARPIERCLATATSGYLSCLPLLARKASAENWLWWPGLAS
jgi:hypothetical protein